MNDQPIDQPMSWYDQSRFAYAGHPDEWDDVRHDLEQRVEVAGLIHAERLG